MKIYRIINGCDPEAITLTPSELREAYLEAQKEYDMEDVRMNYGYYDMIDDCADIDGIELISEDEWNTVGVAEAAKTYRDSMSDSDGWWYILRDSVEYTVRRMIADKKNNVVSA